MTGAVRLSRPAPGIARLELSQPARRNALSSEMWEAIPQHLDGLDARVLLVSGEGDHFAAGADISEFETLYATPESAKTASERIARALDAVAEFPAPTVAVVRGACVGGGAGLALACDMRFADTTARFAITPAKLGLVYPFADVVRLADAVGTARAKDILLSARVVDAGEADRMGLWTRLLPPDELGTEAMRYATDLAALSPESLRATKAMFRRLETGQRTGTPETDALFLDGFASDDFQEGFRAFLEKRKPEFGDAT